MSTDDKISNELCFYCVLQNMATNKRSHHYPLTYLDFDLAYDKAVKYNDGPWQTHMRLRRGKERKASPVKDEEVNLPVLSHNSPFYICLHLLIHWLLKCIEICTV